MGIIDFLKKVDKVLSEPQKPEPKRSVVEDDYGLGELIRKEKQADKEIEMLQAADKQYYEDNDINKRIAVYESILNRQPEWNNFNFCLSLLSMYEKTEQYQKGWAFANRMISWFTVFPVGDMDKIRYAQFRILKKEKKYADALRMLTLSYIHKAQYYSLEDLQKRIVKDGKTTAKGVGLSVEDLEELGKLIKQSVNRNKKSEKDALTLFDSFAKKKGIVAEKQ